MDKKHYTPTIDEFRVGFEYEQLHLNDHPAWKGEPTTWNKEIVTEHDLFEDFQDCMENGLIRVKYLDMEDIESLGWTDFQHSVNDWYKWNKTVECPISFYTYQALLLQHDIPSSGIRIIGYEYEHEMKEDKNGVNLFRGTIKNKSELKKLMTQLGII